MQPADPTTTDHQYTLQELTDAAGVSSRTVRYYITEGLLPPPVVAGPQSHYTNSHLKRLTLIGLLKSAYLPLREIRRRITALGDCEIDELLKEQTFDQRSTEASPTATIHESAGDDASAYIARALQYSSPVRATSGSNYPTKHFHSVASLPLSPAIPPSAPGEQVASRDASTPWRRIPLTADAELHIREDAYERKREQIGWLTEWARKVFD